MAVVTVSRLMGSAGDDIALGVSEKLGYDLVDTGLIIEVAKRAGVSVDKVRPFDEKYQTRVVEWLKGVISPRMGKILAGEHEHMDPVTFIEYAKTIILGLAEKGNIVIVGRASQFILKDNETSFHTRIIADDRFRTERMMRRHSINGQKALEMIHKSDNMRKNYIERYFHADWTDANAYHMILNSSKLGIDETVDIIYNAVEKFGVTHEYIPGVRDRRRRQRRSGKDRRKSDRRAADLWTKEQEKRAVMKGRPVRTSSKPERRKTERRTSDRRES